MALVLVVPMSVVVVVDVVAVDDGDVTAAGAMGVLVGFGRCVAHFSSWMWTTASVTMWETWSSVTS